MLKPYSTKRPRPIPVEFEPNFIEGGWSRVNHMFGKNPAVRYFTALGVGTAADCPAGGGSEATRCG
jgi:hypothetical protein